MAGANSNAGGEPAGNPGRVYLVGAGPGDPGLLTLRAVECLRLADFVLYDYLTSPRTLVHIRPEAEVLGVHQLPGEHPQRWPFIHERLIQEARRGRQVVHLKGGDPLIFGRGGEELEALRQAGIPHEIVPGVSAALAAGAYAEIPLTHRGYASAVAFVTGHEHPEKPESRLDWNSLARFPGTLVLYMTMGRLGPIARELVARGQSAETPAAVVQQASTGDQRTVLGTLGDIEVRARDAGLSSPAVLLVGPVVKLRPERSWFECRPLFGCRVLITRPPTQSQPLARRLEHLGAVPYVLPVLDVAPPEDWTDADAAMDRLRHGEYHWLVFTSANGVRGFFARLAERGLDARSLASVRLAVIGSATARALREQRLSPDLESGEEMNSETLARDLVERARGGNVLLAQAVEGRPWLREELGRTSAVEVVSVYRQVSVVDAQDPAFDQLRRGELDFVTLTSPNIARVFLDTCDEVIRERLRKGPTCLVVNSARLQRQLASEGYPSVLSPDPTDDGLLTAMRQRVERNSGPT